MINSTKRKNIKKNRKVSKLHKLNKKLNYVKNVTKKSNIKQYRKYSKKINQSGGGILDDVVDFFEHPYKMYKFNKFISEFNKTKEALHSEYSSFEAESDIYKEVANNKVKFITEWLTASKVNTIASNFLKNEADLDPILKKKFQTLVKVSKEQKEIFEKKIKRLEKDMNKNKKEFQRMNKKFVNNINKFEKMITKYRKQSDFKQRIDTINMKFEKLSKKDKKNLSRKHKDVLKRYLKHKSDYEKIKSFTDGYLERTSQFVKEYTELRRDAEFYNKIFYEKSTSSKEGDLKKWGSVISTFYDDLESVLNDGKGYSKKLKELSTKMKNVGFRMRAVDSKKLKTVGEIMDILDKCIEHQDNINDLILKLRINFSNNQPAIRMHYDSQLIFSKIILIRKLLQTIHQKMKKL